MVCVASPVGSVLCSVSGSALGLAVGWVVATGGSAVGCVVATDGSAVGCVVATGGSVFSGVSSAGAAVSDSSSGRAGGPPLGCDAVKREIGEYVSTQTLVNPPWIRPSVIIHKERS